MAEIVSLSKSGICTEYSLTEATLAHLEDLELFDSSNGKVVRGERRYPISAALKDTFDLARVYYPNTRSEKIPMLPCQRAIVFYLISSGPDAAYKILNDRGFVVGKRLDKSYFTALFNKIVKLAPPSIRKWVKGEEELPTDANEKAIDLYLDILGLVDFWEDPDQVELSFLYDNIQVRYTVEGLLCTQAKYDEIADVVATQFDMDVQPVDIEIYHRFYFDKDLVSGEDWEGWIKSLGAPHRRHIQNSMNLTFSEYARKFRVAKHLSTSEELDAMLAVSQQGFWQHKEAASYGSMDAIKKQQILLHNSLRLFEARMSLAPTDVSSVNDRLKMEFEKPTDLKILNRNDFDPNEIDSPKVAKEAGLRDPSIKEQGA